MLRDVTSPVPAPEPERLRQILHDANPALRMTLPPYDPDGPALWDPGLYGTEAGQPAGLPGKRRSSADADVDTDLLARPG